jgi:tRNA (mo5U34)-methyltransferase
VLNLESLFFDLDEIGLKSWREPLTPLLIARMSADAHGDIARWKDILRQLPLGKIETTGADQDAVVIGAADLAPERVEQFRVLLQGLMPWRKGPFRVHGIDLDTEWRSNMKWNRLRHAIEPLDGRTILDVGSGNGYYAFRMKNAGAARVIGIDPTVLFVCQFLALRQLSNAQNIHVLPLRLNDLPTESKSFDTTFSMGVLYHQRDPATHLAQLRDTLRSGGELVLETLILPGEDLTVVQPENRYARMRNVWHLPTVPAVKKWLAQAGFRNIRVADVSATTTDEQRSTPWMTFESLAQSLNPDDPSRTIEGLPAPTRAILTGNAP